MICKVTFGAGGGNLVRYVTHEKELVASGQVGYVAGDQHELGAVEYVNLLADSPLEAAREMRSTARLAPRCPKPYAHIMLSWHPDERPSEVQMIAAMKSALEKVGLSEHQAVLAIHREKAHLHCHAVVNRVGADGRAWEKWRSVERLIRATRAVEIEIGFTTPRSRERTADDRRSARERRIAERSGRDPATPETKVREARQNESGKIADRIRASARKALRSAKTWDEARASLAAIGIAIEDYAHPTTSRKGLSLIDVVTGERCAASDIGSDYGRLALERRLGPFVAPETARIRKERPQERPPREDSPLWQAYDRDRAMRRASRSDAMRAQRDRDKVRREEIRAAHRAQCDRLWKMGFRGAALQAAKSEMQFAYAKQREALQNSIRAEREALHAETRAQTWTEFVVARAEHDELAAKQIYSWTKRNRKFDANGNAIAGPALDEESTPTLRDLAGLKYKTDLCTGEVSYFWADTGREAFRDRGVRLDVRSAVDRDDIRAALKMSAAKWGSEVELTGSDEFKQAAVEEAVSLGMTVSNIELVEVQDRAQQAYAARRQQSRGRERIRIHPDI